MTIQKASLALGNRRLLQLAKILDKAEQYNQTYYYDTREHETPGEGKHTCNTPACALGWWAATHPKTWTMQYGKVYWRLYPGNAYVAAELEFCLSHNEIESIFGGSGCRNAQSGPDAAAYIREFVRNRKLAQRRALRAATHKQPVYR